MEYRDVTQLPQVARVTCASQSISGNSQCQYGCCSCSSVLLMVHVTYFCFWLSNVGLVARCRGLLLCQYRLFHVTRHNEEGLGDFLFNQMLCRTNCDNVVCDWIIEREFLEPNFPQVSLPFNQQYQIITHQIFLFSLLTTQVIQREFCRPKFPQVAHLCDHSNHQRGILQTKISIGRPPL